MDWAGNLGGGLGARHGAEGAEMGTGAAGGAEDIQIWNYWIWCAWAWNPVSSEAGHTSDARVGESARKSEAHT